MTRAHSTVLEQALAALRAPALLAALRARPLPEDMLSLIRLAAREEDSVQHAIEQTHAARNEIIEAAVFLIQQLMFAPHGDSYRVLGVDAEADDARIKENYRWLMRWLHPDRNGDEWEAVFADRVSGAWQDLRTPDRRQAYDRERAIAGAAPLADTAAAARYGDVMPLRRTPALGDDDLLLSARASRHLPTLILGGLAIVAIGVLGLQYTLQTMAVSDDAAQAPAPVSALLPPGQSPEAGAATETESGSGSAWVEEEAATEIPAALLAPAASAAAPIVAEQPAAPIVAEQPAATPVGPAARARPRRANAPPSAPAMTRSKPAPSSRPMTRRERRRAAAESAALAAASGPVGQSDAATTSGAHTGAIKALPSGAGNGHGEDAPLIDDASAGLMIERFRSAYRSGDLARIEALLSSDRHGDQRAILRSYRQLFGRTDDRSIDIHDASWLVSGDTAIVIASFDAWILPRGRQQRQSFSGDIRFDLKREGGELRIARLHHDDGGG